MLHLEEDSDINHLKNIAAYFKADLDESNDASTITMDNDKGKGFISSYQLFNGLSVGVYNITFLKDFKINLALMPDGPIYFCYAIKGQFLHRYGELDELSKVLQNQSMIVIGSPNNSAQLTFPKNIKLEIAVIVVDIKLLKSLEIRNAKRMSAKIQKIFQKIPKNEPYRYLGKINVETAKYASIVCDNKSTTLIGGLHTEGAVLNMLASQIKAYNEDCYAKSTKNNLSKSELAKLTSLGNYVLNNMDTQMTIHKLSTIYQLSPKKLQIGVKQLYGDTVGHYISNLRMGRAKHLFMTTEFNVSEVCYEIGLSSQSYFSKIFKKRYGVLPSSFKNQ